MDAVENLNHNSDYLYREIANYAQNCTSELRVLYYSHAKYPSFSGFLQSNFSFEVPLCNSFDELLSHLEEDNVELIIFDNTVNSQEIKYIIHWARIFQPALKHIIPI